MRMFVYNKQMFCRTNFPSTKLCSGCGAKKSIPLSEREYVCGKFSGN